MYEYIRGKLVKKEATKTTLDVNGVGYLINVPVTTSEALPSKNEEVKLLIFYHVREDTQRLYGFYTEEERKLFKMLIGISGIGPKTALTMLSGASPSEFKKRIVSENIDALTTIPGIGKKTAKRIIMELEEKIDEMPEDNTQTSTVTTSVEAEINSAGIEALMELGYNKRKAKKGLKKAISELGAEKDIQDYIKYALANM